MSPDPDRPPEFGELNFSLPVAPVSQQASSAAKLALRAEVRKVTSPLAYILNGDVQVEVQWLVHERTRYETDTAPDVDNILKPVMDGLCGRDGVLIDDCQLQCVTSLWIDWGREDQQLDVRIRFSPTEYLYKDGLSFVRLIGPLCFPIQKQVREKGLQSWLDDLERAAARRAKWAEMGVAEEIGRYAMPRGAMHRSRIRDFPVHELAELRTLS